jgi:DegV family protein with EDD domain
LLVPINIQFGQTPMRKGINSSKEVFTQGQRTEHHSDDLAAVASQYIAAYSALCAETDTDAIVSLHITSHLSGTFHAAVLAANQMPSDGPPIIVFDSLSGSMGLGFMVLEAAVMAEAGGSVEEILARLEILREKMRIFFSLYDLRFARMSGRVGMAKALLASILDIKLLLTVEDGRLALFRRVRSQAQAMRALVMFCRGDGRLAAQVAVDSRLRRSRPLKRYARRLPSN